MSVSQESEPNLIRVFRKAYEDGFSPLALPPLLRTESPAGYQDLLDQLLDELQPRGIIAETFVADAAHHLWNVLRLRRAQVGLINGAFREALISVLLRVGVNYRHDAERLTNGYFSTSEKEREVQALLAKFGLDEAAVIAEATRLLGEDAERLQRMEIEAERRRDKALRNGARHNRHLAERLRSAGDRALNENAIPSSQPREGSAEQ